MGRDRLLPRLLVVAALGLGTVGVPSDAQAHTAYCGHGTHFDLRHPQYRMEFVREYDRRGRHYHRVVFHRQLLGVERYVTTVRCVHGEDD